MSQSRKKVDTRVEADSLGEVEIPATAYWGIATERVLEKISPPELKTSSFLIRAFALTKRAAATVNSDLNFLEKELAGAITVGCEQLQNGALDDSIVVSGYHGSLGSGLNTNVNEVIANYANNFLGKGLGTYAPIEPWKHVNLNHGVNDAYITAMRLSILLSLDTLTDSLLELERMLRRKSLQFERVIKTGRVCLQDSSPVTLGQELNAHGSSIEKSLRRILECRESFKEVNLGGGDTGTGYNIASSFRDRIIGQLSELSGFDLKPPDDYFRLSSSLTDFAHFSSTTKDLALDLCKIASDLRLMSSGPAAGLGELSSETNRDSSSKSSALLPSETTNQIGAMAESLIMICHHICGNDLSVSLAQTSGILEANGASPMVIHKILESISLLAHSIDRFSRLGLSSISARQSDCLAQTEKTSSFREMLSAEIGEMKAEEVVKGAKSENKDVKTMLQERETLPAQRIEAFYHHRTMTSAKRIIPFIKEGAEATGTAPVEEDKGQTPGRDGLK